MTSKNLFFKLLKENAKRRLWTVALIFLAFFFLLPVSTAMMASDYLSPDRFRDLSNVAFNLAASKTELLERYLEWTSVKNGALIFMMVLSAVICGASGFSYLHSRQKTDFYHSAPVRRETWFFTAYVNGILFMAVPYLMSLVISSLIIQVKAAPAFPWGTVLSAFVMHMAFYLLIYSTVILAIILTGNLLVGLLGASVFFFWGPGVLLLKTAYCGTYFSTYYESLPQSLIFKSSPLFWYFSVFDPEMGNGTKAIWALAAAILLTALSVVLYKIRPSEAAGHAMAFGKSRFVIKFLLVVPFALLGSLLFHEMKQSDGWSIFGLICGLLISYAVIEIIYNFDFRKLFAHRIQLAACTLCAAAILLLFRFDLSGYDSYVPSQAKIEDAGISCYTLDGNAIYNYLLQPELDTFSSERSHYVSWNYPSEAEAAGLMKITDVSEILEIVKQGVSDAERSKANPSQRFRQSVCYDESYTDNRETYESFGTVVVNYHLKNGKTPVRRYYMMNLSAVRDALDAVYNKREYKEAVYPILNLKAEEIAGVNYQEQREYSHVKLTDAAMKEKLLTAYQEDLMALTAADRREESPVAAIQFKTNDLQEMIDLIRSEEGDFTVFNEFFYYPIYPSFEKTIGLLRQCGTDVGSLLTPESVQKIELKDYAYRDHKKKGTSSQETRPYTVTVTDPKQIEEILDASVPLELNCSNDLNSVITDIDVRVHLKKPVPGTGTDSGSGEGEQADGKQTDGDDFTYENIDYRDDSSEDDGVYDVALDSDKIPEFVKKAFQFDEERIKSYPAYGY